MGLGRTHRPELSFSFSSTRVLEPDLDHSLLQPHFSCNVIKHFSGRVGIQQVLFIENFELLRSDGGSQAFITVLVFAAIPALLFTAIIVFLIVQFPFKGSSNTGGGCGVGSTGLWWHLRERAPQKLSCHQRIVGVKYHVGHVHGSFQERRVEELVLSSKEMHMLVFLPKFQGWEGYGTLITWVLE